MIIPSPVGPLKPPLKPLVSAMPSVDLDRVAMIAKRKTSFELGLHPAPVAARPVAMFSLRKAVRYLIKLCLDLAIARHEVALGTLYGLCGEKRADFSHNDRISRSLHRSGGRL